MDTYGDIPSRPYTFRGALAFNQRTVSSAISSLMTKGIHGGQAISLPELANILLLLESMATSTRMCLDGTLPPGDVEEMGDALREVNAQSGVAVEIEFLKPSPDSLVSMFKSAAEAATLLIERDLATLDGQHDPPMKGDISKFVETLTKASGSSDASDIARNIADKAAQGVETFRGSKCLAGLILAEQDPAPLLQLAATRIIGGTDDVQRKAIAVLVNRFRINYVNSLAAMRDAAYLADGTIEDLKAAQVLLFSRFFAKKIAEQHVQELSAATQAVFDRSLSGVPLGFAILMNSRGQTAVSLLEEAMRVRDTAFAAAAAHDSPQARYLHQLDEAEFAGFRDYLFSGQWADLVHAAERAGIASCPWRDLQIPRLLSAAGLALTAAAVIGQAGVPLAFAAGISIVPTVDAAANDKVLGTAVSLDQYRKFDRYFAHAAQSDRIAQALSERVEQLFGRRLDLAA